MQQDLAEKYRPKTLDEVFGNQNAKLIISSWKRVPQKILLRGDTGCGKSTIAYIIAKTMIPNAEIININGVDRNGKEDMQALLSTLQYKPLGKENRVIIIDEAQKISPYGQEVLLQPLENLEPYNYVIFTTTNPESIGKALLGRFVHLNIYPLNASEGAELIDKIYCAEHNITEGELQAPYSDSLCKMIWEKSNGSARNIINNLVGILHLTNEEITEKHIASSKEEATNRSLVTLLLSGASMAEIALLLKDMNASDIEGVRRGVLKYASKVYFNNTDNHKGKKAMQIIANFVSPFHDSEIAGLLLACYNTNKTQ